jgi:hypothetical protein
VGNRRTATLVALLLVTSGCTIPPLVTPTPRPTPTPTPLPILTPSPSPSATPSPTPLLGAIPAFSAGELIATRIDGLRVRQRPSTSSTIVTGLLPLDAWLQAIMGPIVVDDVGWYLVADANAAEPTFDEGWVAAGREPDPFLGSTGEVSGGSPYLASFAQTGDAEYGPVEIGDGDHAIRWVALDPERVRCTFAVSLAAGAADPVPAIRATIGNAVVPGTLQPGSFAALGVRGQVFVTVTSDCAWTFVIQRVVEPSPTPAAS